MTKYDQTNANFSGSGGHLGFMLIVRNDQLCQSGIFRAIRLYRHLEGAKLRLSKVVAPTDSKGTILFLCINCDLI